MNFLYRYPNKVAVCIAVAYVVLFLATLWLVGNMED